MSVTKSMTIAEVAHCALSLWRLVAVAQMPTMREIQTHEPVVWPHDGLVGLQVCRATTQALDIDPPFLGIQAKRLERAFLAEQLDSINVLVSAVVSGSRVALGVLVRHWRAESIENGAGGDILRGDQEDGLALALDFPLLIVILVESRGLGAVQSSHHNLCDLLVRLDQGFLHELS